MAREETREVVYLEREGGSMGPLLLGAVLGLAAGLLLAPHSGGETRRRIQRRMRQLQDLVGDEVAELREGLTDREEGEAEAGPPTTREAIRGDLERRLAEARGRRRAARSAEADEDEEPVA
jgi:gas vesicle protein